MNQNALGLAAAIVAIGHEPPDTTPPEDEEEDVELGFCVGCLRLDVDDDALFDDELELVVDDLLVSEELDDVVDGDVVEFDDDVVV